MLLATSIMTGSDQLLRVSHVFVIDTALDSSYPGPYTDSRNGGGSAAKPPLRSAASHGSGLGVHPISGVRLQLRHYKGHEGAGCRSAPLGASSDVLEDLLKTKKSGLESRKGTVVELLKGLRDSTWELSGACLAGLLFHVVQALNRSFPSSRVIGTGARTCLDPAGYQVASASLQPEPGGVAGMACFTRTECWALSLFLDPPGSALPGTLKGRSVSWLQHWSCLRFVPLRSCLTQQFQDKSCQRVRSWQRAELDGQIQVVAIVFDLKPGAVCPAGPAAAKPRFRPIAAS